MSSSRPTRAASRVASSRGASPAVSAVDIPITPRRTARRAGNAALPAVGLRQSTAYGTNNVANPARLGTQTLGFEDVLENIRNPVDPNANANERGSTTGRSNVTSSRTPQRRGNRATTPATNERSFTNESHLFNGAEFESSPADPDLTQIAEESEHDDPEHEDEAQRHKQRREVIEVLARQRLERPRADPTHGIATNQPPDGVWRQRLSDSLDWLRGAAGQASLLSEQAWHYLKTHWWILPAIFVFLIGTTFMSTAGEYRNYGWDVKHNIGQFVPNWLAHPVDSLNPDQFGLLKNRVDKLEYDLAYIKNRPGLNIDPKTVDHLNSILPNALIVKKDKYGTPIIPTDFWRALQEKIRSDETLVVHQVEQAGKQSTALSVKDVERVVGNKWDEYIKRNKNKLGAMSDKDFTDKFPALLEENHIASKDQVLELIRQNWEEKSKDIKAELQGLTTELTKSHNKVLDLERNALSEVDVKAISDHIAKKYLSSLKLQAQAKANQKGNLNYGAEKLNYFAWQAGAAVGTKYTSPAYIFPALDYNPIQRFAYNRIYDPIPRPNPPKVALTKWEEHGDCWCAGSGGENGFGASLEVIIGAYIYPTEVVIEHISPSASVQPGATPKEMELWAYIPRWSVWEDLKQAPGYKYISATIDNTGMDAEWIKIADWEYDNEGAPVQAFNIESLKPWKAWSNKFVVRSKTNYGGKEVPYTCLYRVRLHGEKVEEGGM